MCLGIGAVPHRIVRTIKTLLVLQDVINERMHKAHCNLQLEDNFDELVHHPFKASEEKLPF